MSPLPISIRARQVALACALFPLFPFAAHAQATWLASVPPERLLRWQPRTPADFANVEELLGSPVRLPFAPGAGSAPSGAPSWSECGPPARAMHSIVYDSRRHRLLLLGGLHVQDPAGTVWSCSLPGGEWTRIAELPWPPDPAASRESGTVVGAVYDSLRDRLLVLPAGDSLRLEALSLDGTPAWSHFWSGPVASDGVAGMAVDTRRDEVALLGAWDAAAAAHRIIRVPLADPSAWTSPFTQGAQPAIPARGAAVYLPGRQEFAVLIGTGSIQAHEDARLYLLNAEGAPAWTSIPLPAFASPAPGWQGDVPVLLSQDDAQDRLLIVGRTGVTLAMPLSGGAPQWLTSAFGPAQWRFGAAAALDPLARRLFLSGGSSGSTLSLASLPAPLLMSATVDSAAAWVGGPPRPGEQAAWLAVTGNALGSRWGHGILVDPDGAQLLAMGYTTPGVVARPLVGPGGWSVLGAGSDSLPRVRFGQSVELDPTSHALLLYGGQATDGSGDLLSDLWQLSLAPGGRWQRIEVPGPTPGMRRNATLVHDFARSRFVLLGGDDLHAHLLDAWELRLGAAPGWRPLDVVGPMAPYQAVYPDDIPGEAWSVYYGPGLIRRVSMGADAILFEDVPSTGAPLPFAFPPVLAGFDPMQQRLFWFPDPYRSGGLAIPLTQLWTTMLGWSGADWRLRDLAGPSPTYRGLMALAFDPASSRVLLDGGLMDNGVYFADTWALQLPGDLPTAALASLVEARADADGVHLRWSVSAPAGTACVVERSEDAVNWAEAGTAEWTGADEVRFDGPPIAGAARTAWRLRIALAGGDQMGPITWLASPAAATALAIRPVSNPCRGAPELRLAMSAEATARLRLLDVGGRVVCDASVPAGSTGWIPAVAPPPGLYFAELVQRGERRVTRVVVAP